MVKHRVLVGLNRPKSAGCHFKWLAVADRPQNSGAIGRPYTGTRPATVASHALKVAAAPRAPPPSLTLALSLSRPLSAGAQVARSSTATMCSLAKLARTAMPFVICTCP